MYVDSNLAQPTGHSAHANSMACCELSLGMPKVQCTLALVHQVIPCVMSSTKHVLLLHMYNTHVCTGSQSIVLKQSSTLWPSVRKSGQKADLLQLTSSESLHTTCLPNSRSTARDSVMSVPVGCAKTQLPII